MNSPRYLPLLICLVAVNSLFAQNEWYIPTGPDWKGTDLNGQSHQLYDYLNQGKVVFMDVFSTWCGPCLSYKQSGIFKDVYNIYGPNGTNEARVFAIETDPKTGIPQLYGTPPQSAGNFVEGTPYPTMDKPRLQEAYYADGYPSLYCVCPDRKTFSLPHSWSATALWSIVEDSCKIFNFIQTRIDTVVAAGCKGDKHGEIQMSVLSGVPPYTFDWDNGDSTKNISGLSGGHYVCTITDALGKTGRASAFVPKAPDSMRFNLYQTHVNCQTPGDSNGELSGNIMGGIPPYSVVWSTGETGYWIKNLSAGLYSMTMTDAYGCVKTIEDIVINPKYQPVVALAPAQPISCAQPIAILNGAGSTTFPHDTIYWRKPNGVWVVGDPSFTFPASVPGQYRLTISNWSSSCFSSKDVTVGLDTIRPMAEAGPAKQQTCSGTPVTLQGSGSGAGTLNYVWSTSDGNILSGANTKTPSVSGAGTYTLTVTRTPSGCTRSDVTTVSVLNQTPSTQAVATVLTCTTPTATLTGTASIPGSTFKWTGPGNFISTLNPSTTTQAGIYTLTTTAPGGCSATTTVTVVADQAPPQLTVQTPGMLTCNQLTTLLSASASPAGTILNWNGNGLVNAGPQATVSQAGTYLLVATAPNGCTTTSTVAVLADQSLPVISIQSPGTLSCAQPSLTLSASSPGNMTWLWSTPDGHLVSGTDTPNPIIDAVGTYFVIVTNPLTGCSTQANVSVSGAVPLLVSAALIQAATCPEAADGIAAVSISLGTPPYTFQWSDGQTSAQATGLSAGTVSVQVNDAAGCTELLQLEITWSDVLPPNLLCPADITVSFCHPSVFYDLPVATDNCAIPALPVLVNGLAPGSAFPTGLSTVQYQVTDAGGHTATCSFSVTVEPTLNLSAIVQADTAGTSVGAIDLSVGGGLPPYTFSWAQNNQGIAQTEDLVLAAAGSYAVTVTDAGACTAESVFEIPSITATSDLQTLLGLQIFPNPASDRVMLQSNGTQTRKLKLALYDVRGVLIQEWQLLPGFIEVSAYPTGVYFLQIKSEAGLSLGWAKILVER